jgi:chitodextrinase
VYSTGDRVSYDGRVFEALWYTSGEAPGSKKNGAWAEIAITADGSVLWTPTRIFRVGDVVVPDGRTFEAQWYTRGETPGGVAGAWSEIVAPGPDGIPAWGAATVYTGGEQVTYQGHVYVAQWYTAGTAPGPTAKKNPWKLVS